MNAEPGAPARTHSRRKRWLHKTTHTLKGRLVALFVLLALATTAVFLFGMQRVLQNGWLSYAKPVVADYVDRLAAELGTPPDPARAQALVQRLPISIRVEGPLVQFDTHPRTHTPRRFGPDAEYSPGDNAAAAAGWGLVRNTADGHRITFGLASPPDTERPRIVGWATLAALLSLTALAYATVRHLLAPLQAIGAGVEAYGRGDFSQPIVIKRRDELGDLAGRINGMAGNLSGMLEAKRALLLAISHELRSPLTRARLNAELVAEGPERDALLHDLAEMRDLITGLLESERLGDGHAALQAEPTDVAALVHETLATQFAGQPVQLHLDDTLGPVRADPTRLRLLLRNLLANALRHGQGAAQPPEVRWQRLTGGHVALSVRDHGPGVAPEVLAHLGEAFYRPESARTRSTGGVGLGLHLCRLVAQAHGGELLLRNATPGLEVTFRWPG